MSIPQAEKIRAALYARVSTEEQREGQTIESQIAELARFAASSEWIVSDTYQDDGWSGSMLARPELDRLRDDAAKGLFQAVLFNDVDRLARDVTHLGIIKRDLERHGVQVVFRKLPNEKSPTHNLMVNILGSFAEFERELISDRTRRGRRHKVETRKEYLGSRPPYGYRYIPIDRKTGANGYLEVEPEEAAVVSKMFRLVDAEGGSARKVVNHLNGEGLKGQKGGPWRKSSVLRILRSETYAGVWHFYKQLSCEPTVTSAKYRKSLKSSRRARPKAEWLPVTLPENLWIVDRDVWERVQARLDRNVTFSPRNSKHNYMLKGLIQCGGCGGRYVGDPGHGKFSYRCIRRCKLKPMIQEETLNELVWNSLSQAMLNPEVIAAQVEKHNAEIPCIEKSHAVGPIDTQAALTQLQNEESRLLEAYRLEVITPNQLGEELDKIKGRKDLLIQHQSHEIKEASKTAAPIVRRSIQEYCERAASVLSSYSRDQRQEFMRNHIRTITFNGESIQIRGVIPIGPTEQDKGVALSPINPLIETPTGERSGRNAAGTATPTARRGGLNTPAKSLQHAQFVLSEIVPDAPRQCGIRGLNGKFVGRVYFVKQFTAVLRKRAAILDDPPQLKEGRTNESRSS